MFKLSAHVSVVLSSNNIAFAHETKYLDVILIEVWRQLGMVFVKNVNFMHRPICILYNYVIVPRVNCVPFKSCCANVYCCPL